MAAISGQMTKDAIESSNAVSAFELLSGSSDGPPGSPPSGQSRPPPGCPHGSPGGSPPYPGAAADVLIGPDGPQPSCPGRSPGAGANGASIPPGGVPAGPDHGCCAPQGPEAAGIRSS